MIHAGVSPNETIIIEDSHVGRKAAMDSGGNLFAVKNPDDVILEDIVEEIKKIDKTQKEVKPKWQGGKMNVLIPMAGAGSRFQKGWIHFPKTTNRSQW